MVAQPDPDDYQTVIATGPYTAQAQDILNEQLVRGVEYPLWVRGVLYWAVLVSWFVVHDGDGGATFEAEFACRPAPVADGAD